MRFNIKFVQESQNSDNTTAAFWNGLMDTSSKSPLTIQFILYLNNWNLHSPLRAKLSKPHVLTFAVTGRSLLLLIDPSLASFVILIMASPWLSEQNFRKGPPIHVAKKAFMMFFNKCSISWVVNNGGRQFNIPVPERNRKNILSTSNNMYSTRRILPRCLLVLLLRRTLNIFNNMLNP